MNEQVNKIKDYLELTKFKIMIPVSLTGFTGYFIYNPHISSGLVFTSTGILLMAISSSILNQIQEVEVDSKMVRTQSRPLPAGRIKSKNAFILFLINLIAGFSLIYAAGNLKAALIGLLTVVWYNGVYTNLKRITSFAVVPGAITGALPPLIGWVAAGGGLWEKHIVFIEFLFFTGQIPHFWLLILRYGEEYSNAGIPSLTTIFNRIQINRLTFTWVVTSVIAALFLCYFEIIKNNFVIGGLVIASILIIWQFFNILKPEIEIKEYRKYSVLFDVYFLLILIFLISDSLIN
jgi:heme o synthase